MCNESFKLDLHWWDGIWEKWYCSGHALLLSFLLLPPPTTLWPGFDSWTFCHKWVVSSHLCLKDFFLWVSVLYAKHHAKFQPCFLRDKHFSIFNQWLLPSINVHGVNFCWYLFITGSQSDEQKLQQQSLQERVRNSFIIMYSYIQLWTCLHLQLHH